MRYHRDVLVTVLVHHRPKEDSSCYCGWRILGHSWADHVADVYENFIGNNPEYNRPSERPSQ